MPSNEKTMKKSINIKKLSVILICTIIAILILFPIVWMVFTSFKTDTEALVSGTKLLPKQFTFENYKYAFQLSGMGVSVGRWVFNSLFVSITGTIIVLIIDSLAGYALARLKVPFGKFLFAMFISTMMIPWVVSFLPLYLEFNGLNLLDTYAPLILPYSANAFGIFLIYQFLEDFPKELEEAAYIEGANKLQVFLRVVVPTIKPVLWTLGIFTFMGIYNDFLWPLVSTMSPEMRTISAGVAIIQQGNVAKFGKLMAVSTIATIPSVLIFMIGQKYLVKGIAHTGMK